MRRTLLLLLLTVPAGTALSQIAATLSGTVTDTTGAPISNANVFIATSTVGTTTDDAGRYTIPGVGLGTLRLVVSSVGYQSQHEDLFVREARVYTRDFQLHEKVYELGALTVTADNRRWKRQLERFTELFIGESPNARQTKILNPEVIDFSGRGGEFRAQSSEPLIIENRGLGYKLTYFLNEFVSEPTSTRWDGEPLFEPLEPSSAEESAQWNARRDSAFYGSFRHFLLAVINDQVEEQGYRIYSSPGSGGTPALQRGQAGFGNTSNRFPIKASEIIRAGSGPDERILDFQGFIDIVYVNELETAAFLALQRRTGRARYQTSTIRLDKGATVVDLKGDTLDPYGVTFYGGYFAYERVGDQMPREYRPWIADSSY
ncbi:MAG: carboxypeptidase-like regulatory domain-containing protein [Bacteroidota bacterium]|nr:carboxypeptidase-like regulatory domain-containing protein [Bacteroidota bacterium]